MGITKFEINELCQLFIDHQINCDLCISGKFERRSYAVFFVKIYMNEVATLLDNSQETNVIWVLNNLINKMAKYYRYKQHDCFEVGVRTYSLLKEYLEDCIGVKEKRDVSYYI